MVFEYMRFIGKFNLDLERLAYLKRKVTPKQLKGGALSPVKPLLFPITPEYKDDFEKVFVNSEDLDKFNEFYADTNLPLGMVAKLKDTTFNTWDDLDSPFTYSYRPSVISKKPVHNPSKTDEVYDSHILPLLSSKQRSSDVTGFETVLRDIYERIVPVTSKSKASIIPSVHKVPYDMDLYDYVTDIHEDFNVSRVKTEPQKQFFYYEVQPAIDTRGFSKGNEIYKPTRGVSKVLSKYLTPPTNQSMRFDVNFANWMVSDDKLLSFDPVVPNRFNLEFILKNYV